MDLITERKYIFGLLKLAVMTGRILLDIIRQYVVFKTYSKAKKECKFNWYLLFVFMGASNHLLYVLFGK